MSDSITLNKSDRYRLFANVLLLTKAFVELAAYASKEIECVDEQSSEICEMASMVSLMTMETLGFTNEEAITFTRKVYEMEEDFNKLSNLSIDDFLNTDA